MSLSPLSVTLDTAMATSNDRTIKKIVTNLGTLKWADDYRQWEKEHLEKVADNVKASIARNLDLAKQQIWDEGKGQNSQLLALADEIQDREGDTFTLGVDFEEDLLP